MISQYQLLSTWKTLFVDNVHKDHRLVLHKLEAAADLSYGPKTRLIITKLCARRVLKMLSDDMKLSRVSISGSSLTCLTQYNANPDSFHFRFGS